MLVFLLSYLTLREETESMPRKIIDLLKEQEEAKKREELRRNRKEEGKEVKRGRGKSRNDTFHIRRNGNGKRIK